MIVYEQLLPSLFQRFEHQFLRHIRVGFAFGGAGYHLDKHLFQMFIHPAQNVIEPRNAAVGATDA